MVRQVRPFARAPWTPLRARQPPPAVKLPPPQARKQGMRRQLSELREDLLDEQAQAQEREKAAASGARDDHSAAPADVADDAAGEQSPGKWRRFRQAFPKASHGARDFLSRCLTFDPAGRITARAALQLPYFRLPYAGSCGPYSTAIARADKGSDGSDGSDGDDGGDGGDGGDEGGSDGSDPDAPPWSRQLISDADLRREFAFEDASLTIHDLRRELEQEARRYEEALRRRSRSRSSSDTGSGVDDGSRSRSGSGSGEDKSADTQTTCPDESLERTALLGGLSEPTSDLRPAATAPEPSWLCGSGGNGGSGGGGGGGDDAVARPSAASASALPSTARTRVTSWLAQQHSGLCKQS